MGNAILGEKENADNCQSEDLEWLNIQNSAIFNDAYVSSVYEKLPAFEGTALPNVIEYFDLCNLIDSIL